VHLTYNTQRGLQISLLLQRLEALTGAVVQICGLSASVARASEMWRLFRPGREVTVIQDTETRPIDCVIRPVSDASEIRRLLDQLGNAGRTKVLVFRQIKARM
jgi:ATP-dependent helicase Lhr and Lhr-like helicase